MSKPLTELLSELTAAVRESRLGGQLVDGYLRDPKRDRERTQLRNDDDRRPTYDRLFALGLRGVGSGEVARILNDAGAFSANSGRRPRLSIARRTAARSSSKPPITELTNTLSTR